MSTEETAPAMVSELLRGALGARRAPDNDSLRWYRRLVWFGVCANMSFALLALYRPHKLQAWLGLQRLSATVWLRNVGMLLVLVSMFNAGSARAPLRYPLFSYMVPTARLIAAFFFIRIGFFNPHDSSEKPQTFFTLGVFDLTMGLVCGLLLHRGLPPERRLSLRNVTRGTI